MAPSPAEPGPSEVAGVVDSRNEQVREVDLATHCEDVLVQDGQVLGQREALLDGNELGRCTANADWTDKVSVICGCSWVSRARLGAKPTFRIVRHV
jgi:hypothetical protein